MAKPGLLFILYQPLLQDIVAQGALKKWYTHQHIQALLALNLGPKTNRRVYCYQSVDSDHSGPGGFFSICPSINVTSLSKSALQNVLSSEQIVPPSTASAVTTEVAKLFTLPPRPLVRRELEKDPREGGAHLRKLEEAESKIDWSSVDFIEIPPEPPRDDLENPHEGFLDPDTPFDIDVMDYQNYPDYDPDQDFNCVLEAPSESSEPHYMDIAPNIYAESVPPEGLPLKQAMTISSREYEEMLNSDYQAYEESRPELAPYLLITRVPSRSDLTDVENAAAFKRHFKRYPYLTDTEYHRRHTGYRELHTTHASWLVVQELNGPGKEWTMRWFDLKKQEAKAWWKRQGFIDAKLDFYRLVETFGAEPMS